MSEDATRFDPFAGRTVHISHFFAPAYVVCPRCGERAKVWRRDAAMLEGKPVPRPIGEARLSLACPRCTHRASRDLREWANWNFQFNPESGGYTLLPIPRRTGADPFFRCPYWAQAMVRRETLWLVNRSHAAALRRHVRTPDRVCPPPTYPDRGYKDWRQRLPGWIATRKNRDLVLKAIDRAERRLDEAEAR
ncbi:MAG: hypothetical protein ACFBWO_09980 [Paracoccaceae bacterium]